MANVAYNKVTENSFYCYADNLDANYSRGDRTVSWYVNSSLRETVMLSAKVSSGGGTTVYSLTPNTVYSVYAVIRWSSSATSGLDKSTTLSTISVKTLAPRPPKFDWDNWKSSNQNFNLTAMEWQKLITNVNAVRQYKGIAAYGSHPNYYRGMVFSANHYNNMAWAINAIPGLPYWQKISTQSTGNIITAECINMLRNAVNSVE